MFRSSMDLVAEYAKPILIWAAAHPKISSGVVAISASWLLYGVLGKRYLGADDDYWPKIRNKLLPILDKIGQQYGFSAETASHTEELVGVVELPEDELELDLAGAGYLRNPLAALKESPQGWKSDGSWAKRTGKMRVLGDQLRRAEDFHIPVLDSYVSRFLQATGDIFALHMIHITIFARQQEDGSWKIWVYAHWEYNNLNPFTAFMHYTAVGQSAEKGVKLVKKDFELAGIEVQQPDQ